MKTSERDALLRTLEARFAEHKQRHQDLTWSRVRELLVSAPKLLASLHTMEETGGEPDVIRLPDGAYAFCDCASESPTGRRSLCYDRAALDARKANKPKGSAAEAATKMGVALLTEEQYRHLQTLGTFDTKTSSWIATPKDVRDLGGALFCDRRFGRVFVYHNGAESYYAARGFRGWLPISP